MTQSYLRIFGTGLAQICTTYHYRAPENVSPGYAVWQELGGSALMAENRPSELLYELSVDYYTRTEFDATIDAISAFLDSYGSWRLESVQFEQETGLIHYEWRLDYA